MTPRHRISIMLACLLLASCSKDEASQSLDTVGNETSTSYDKMRNYLDLGHETKPVVTKAAQARYCYHTYEDIICYSKPLPGEEYRLVAFQNQRGKTGYTMPPTNIPDDVRDDSVLPQKSAEAMPPEAGSGDKQNLKEIIFDPNDLQPKELVPGKQQ